MKPDRPDGDDESVNLLAVILGSVGGVVLLVFIVGAAVVLCKRRRQRNIRDALKQVCSPEGGVYPTAPQSNMGGLGRVGAVILVFSVMKGQGCCLVRSLDHDVLAFYARSNSSSL